MRTRTFLSANNPSNVRDYGQRKGDGTRWLALREFVRGFPRTNCGPGEEPGTGDLSREVNRGSSGLQGQIVGRGEIRGHCKKEH